MEKNLTIGRNAASAVGGALIGGTLVELGAGKRGNLGIQRDLKAAAHDLRDQAPAVVASMSWLSLEEPLLVKVMICVRLGGGSPNRVTDRPTGSAPSNGVTQEVMRPYLEGEQEQSRDDCLEVDCAAQLIYYKT